MCVCVCVDTHWRLAVQCLQNQHWNLEEFIDMFVVEAAFDRRKEVIDV